MSKVLTQIKYTQVVRDIKMIIERGRDGAKQALQRQVVEINWEVGRYLVKHLPLGESPGEKNSKIISHLAREFSQPKVYFNTVIQFYRCYPDCPPNDPELSWADYKALLTIKDSAKPKPVKSRAARKHIPKNYLSGLLKQRKEELLSA